MSGRGQGHAAQIIASIGKDSNRHDLPHPITNHPPPGPPPPAPLCSHEGLTHRQVLLLATKDDMQPFAAQQVHDMAFLVGLHSGEDHHIAHDRLQKSLVTELKHVLQGCTCHTALRLTLHRNNNSDMM